MTNKTWDAEDSRDLPYRFAYSPITQGVFVISFNYPIMGIAMVFENREAFHRFLIEGMRLDDAIADKVIQQSQEILRGKQGE